MFLDLLDPIVSRSVLQQCSVATTAKAILGGKPTFWKYSIISHSLRSFHSYFIAQMTISVRFFRWWFQDVQGDLVDWTNLINMIEHLGEKANHIQPLRASHPKYQVFLLNGNIYLTEFENYSLTLYFHLEWHKRRMHTNNRLTRPTRLFDYGSEV